MSAENEKIKPKTDLELSLNNAIQCDWKNLKNDSGAGANAASRVDMTFAATVPLSEIVWSPDKGLSLKCADSSFADKNSSRFRDVGPSCMVLAPPQSVTGGKSTIDKPVDDVFVKPIAVVCAKSDNVATDAPTMHAINDSGVMPEYKACEENDIGRVDQRPFDNLLLQSDEPKPIMEKNPSPGRPSNEGIDIGTGKKAVVTDDDSHTVVEPMIEYRGSGAPGTNLASSSRSPLEKLESSAENDLPTVDCEAACAATCGVIVNEIKNKSHDNEMMLLRDKVLPVLDSPCNSRIRMTKNKGKEKSMSDGDVNVRLSMEENDSHSSVESCNSGGLFFTGKKRRNFHQQLIIGSKTVKKNIEETSGSKSYIKQDSSFVNWISSMVKGLPQSIQDDSNTLALTFANPGRHNQRSDEKLIACKMNQDPEPRSTGFKSIFQSIYSPSLKNVGTRMFHQGGKGNEVLEPSNMVQGIDATPITFCAENNSLSKQYLQSNKFEATTGRNDAGPSSHPNIKPLNFFNSQESSKSNTVENENCSILGLSKDKEEMASHSSSTRQNTNDTENVDSNTPSEGKEAENIRHRRDNLGSLWITRFSPKSTAPLIISDHNNERDGSQVHSNYCSKLPDSHKHIPYLNCKIEETGEQHANDTEASTALKEDKGDNDHKSKYLFNTLSSSPGFTNSEPMASVFARRLGAIKHIMPTNKADCNSRVNMFCLFCGTRDHQLCDCSAVAESELEDLQKNINSYGGLEEHPCLCIKCFQPNHWAVSCPTSISTRKHESEVKTFVNDCIPSGKHLIPIKETSARPLTDEADRIVSGGTIHDGTDHQADQNIDLKRKSNDSITFNVECNAPFKKYCGSSSEENKFKEKPIPSPSRLAERQISHVPEGIFDAVKKLQLSRTDILKWRNAHGSISQLDGFFLRLRLGKWEEDLGGSGYHVACINETERQSSEQDTRKFVSVKVGGIKCKVESQYISNHDFLEEEIKEWWSTTSEAAGVEIPSEEDLVAKFKKKKMLGL